MTTTYEFTMKEMDPRPVASIRVSITMNELADAFDQIFSEVAQYLAGQGITPTGPPFARYHRFAPDGIDLEAGLPVAAPVAGAGRIQAGELPGGAIATTWNLGHYDTLPQAYSALRAWIEAQGRVPGEAPWEVYWTDPVEVSDPADWRTEVFWPIR